MKEDKLDQFIEETLKEDVELLEYMDDISIPDFEETMNKFKQNLEKSQEIKRKSTKTTSIKRKLPYKKLALVAATFVLAVGISVVHHMNPNQNMGGIPSDPNENIQIPNPLIEVKSEEEAEKKCGFHVEKVNYIPNGYEKEGIVYIETYKLVRQIFMDKNNEIIDFEKYREIHDIKGDWNEYDKEEEIKIHNSKVILYYKESKLYKAVWNKDGFVYDILSSKAMEKEEIIKMVENLE